jgi:RND superfamily putative drug exporter
VTIAAEYAIAASVYYFQNIEGLPVPWFLPITVFTAILGVGMDYNSFSISRAAEECLRDCSRDAVGRAVSKAALLVMGLALIMASAYGGLMLSRIPNLRMMGAALSLGVLFAGILASVALTPALIALLGRRAWWPWGPKAEETG